MTEQELTAAVEKCWCAVLKAKLPNIASPTDEAGIRLQTYYLVLQSQLAPRRIQHEQVGVVRHENVDPDANAPWRRAADE